jgi:hypothetical protein
MMEHTPPATEQFLPSNANEFYEKLYRQDDQNKDAMERESNKRSIDTTRHNESSLTNYLIIKAQEAMAYPLNFIMHSGQK